PRRGFEVGVIFVRLPLGNAPWLMAVIVAAGVDEEHFQTRGTLPVEYGSGRLLHGVSPALHPRDSRCSSRGLATSRGLARFRGLGATSGVYISGRRWASRSSSYFPGILTMHF